MTEKERNYIYKQFYGGIQMEILKSMVLLIVFLFLNNTQSNMTKRITDIILFY
jgi:hypothetical protein